MSDDKIQVNRYKLLRDHPFYGFISLNLEPKVNTELPDYEPISTDGKHLFYNPAYVESANDLPVRIAGASDHIALGHLLPSRYAGKDKELWGLACNSVVSRGLAKTFYNGAIPQGWVSTRALGMPPEADQWVEEEIYKWLEQNKPNTPPMGGACGMEQQPSDSGSDPSDGQGDGNEPGNSPFASEADAEQQLRDAMEEAQIYGKMHGHDPYRVYGIDIDAVLHEPIPWQTVLRRFSASVRTTGGADWMRLNKRLPYPWPGKKHIAKSKILFCIDSSGSVDDVAYGEFCAEGDKAEKYCEPRIVIFDAAVQGEFTKFKDIRKRVAYGGTTVQPAFRKHSGENGIVVFTDGELDDFMPRPKAPVLWVIGGRYHSRKFKPPFGWVTYVKNSGH